IGSLVRIGRSLIRIICRRSVALVTVDRGTRLCTVGCTVCRCCGGGLRGGVRGRCGRSGGTGVGVGRGGCLCVRVIRVVGVGGGVGCLLCRGVRIRGRVRRGLRGGLFVGGGFGGCFGVLIRCCRCCAVRIVVGSCLRGGLGGGIVVPVGVGRSRGRGRCVRVRIVIARCLRVLVGRTDRGRGQVDVDGISGREQFQAHRADGEAGTVGALDLALVCRILRRRLLVDREIDDLVERSEDGVEGGQDRVDDVSHGTGDLIGRGIEDSADERFGDGEQGGDERIC